MTRTVAPLAWTVAIVGRPNVGKSTLFNRLIGRRLALVDDQPGVTRDRREGAARLGSLKFRVVDTGGLEEGPDKSIAARIRQQSEAAVHEADVTLFVVDARSGVTPLDQHFARWLRKSGRPVILVANKYEGRLGESGLADAFSLGLGEAVPISAAHGEGLADLYQALREKLPAEAQAPAAAETEAAVSEGPIQLAIVGRPNVGKSTLVNRLVGSERLLVGPEPGLTRDSIAVDWRYKGRGVRLVDTAGLRRQAKVHDRIERFAAADTRRTIDYAEVVVIVIDGTRPMEKQDLAIAGRAIEEGRAVVLAVNKWDLVADRARALAALQERLEKSLPQVRGLAIVPLSGLTSWHVERLMPAVLQAFERWNRRVPTSRLNRWLAAAVENHPPPAVAGRRLRLRYAVQVKARPPTIAIFANHVEALPAAYLRYLANGLRETFDLPGVPIRFHLRKGENPYVEE